MSEEIFDVVNDHDEVIGQAPRREVHARGLWHRAVHVLVYNARGQIFLQKRSLKKDTAAGLWDSSSSGHVDSGEDYDPCAVREVREEIGLHLEHHPERLFKINACRETGWEFCRRVRFNCIRRKLKPAAGLRPTMSPVGCRNVRKILPAPLS